MLISYTTNVSSPPVLTMINTPLTDLFSYNQAFPVSLLFGISKHACLSGLGDSPPLSICFDSSGRIYSYGFRQLQCAGALRRNDDQSRLVGHGWSGGLRSIATFELSSDRRLPGLLQSGFGMFLSGYVYLFLSSTLLVSTAC